VSFVLGASGREAAPAADDPYSFQGEEFIHPLIVRELLGWLSDPAATVLAVDLTSANRSNRFFGEFSRTMRDGRTWIGWVGDNGEYFTYAHIANSPSGSRRDRVLHETHCKVVEAGLAEPFADEYYGTFQTGHSWAPVQVKRRKPGT
jgi:hypothetical protein